MSKLSKFGRYECPVCGGPMKDPPLPENITESAAILIHLRILEILASRGKRPTIRAQIASLRRQAELYREAAAREAAKAS